MAEAISQEEEPFACPVCLDPMKDPVTIACGHNFCMRCIDASWDQEDQKGVYSCPICKQTFTPRPVLHKNPLMTEMVEKFGKAPARCYVELGDVTCDVCTGSKFKAVKSCLDCLVSYCEIHYKIHNDLNPVRKHSVIDATSHLQERICSRHAKVFDIFCRTDQSCICYLCTIDNHKGHNTVTATKELSDKQRELSETQKRFHQRILEREKELHELREAVETLKSSAQTAVEDSERIFTEMIRSIERRRSYVTDLIRAQERAEVMRAEGLLKRLEQEIAELKWRNAELEQLSHTKDHIYFLKSVSSVRGSPHSKDLPSMTFNQTFSFEGTQKSTLKVKEQLEKLDDIFKEEEANISSAVMNIQICQSVVYTDPMLPIRRANSNERMPPKMSDVRTVFSKPVTRDEFLQYSCHFTLDPNTAHRRLRLFEGNMRMERRDELHSYPDHPERFDVRCQVLCREGVSGCSYWEVEWIGGGVYISVSYKSIGRKGWDNECVFGSNDQSWSLDLSSSSSSFWHNNKETKLTLVASSRIGVYVDHRAGTLAFYSISDTMTLLHRVQTEFTYPLYPGFWLTDSGSSVQLL